MCHPVFPGSLITRCACQTGAVPAVLPQPAPGPRLLAPNTECSLCCSPAALRKADGSPGSDGTQSSACPGCATKVGEKREVSLGPPLVRAQPPHVPHGAAWGSQGAAGEEQSPLLTLSPPPPNCRTRTQELLLSPSLAFLMTGLCECHEAWRPGRVGEIQYC